MSLQLYIFKQNWINKNSRDEKALSKALESFPSVFQAEVIAIDLYSREILNQWCRDIQIYAYKSMHL